MTDKYDMIGELLQGPDAPGVPTFQDFMSLDIYHNTLHDTLEQKLKVNAEAYLAMCREIKSLRAEKTDLLQRLCSVEKIRAEQEKVIRELRKRVVESEMYKHDMMRFPL